MAARACLSSPSPTPRRSSPNASPRSSRRNGTAHDRRKACRAGQFSPPTNALRDRGLITAALLATVHGLPSCSARDRTVPAKQEIVITAPMYPPTLEALDADFITHRLWEEKDR